MKKVWVQTNVSFKMLKTVWQCLGKPHTSAHTSHFIASKSFELMEPVSHITSAVTFRRKQSWASLELLMIKSRFIADVHLQKKKSRMELESSHLYISCKKVCIVFM